MSVIILTIATIVLIVVLCLAFPHIRYYIKYTRPLHSRSQDVRDVAEKQIKEKAHAYRKRGKLFLLVNLLCYVRDSLAVTVKREYVSGGGKTYLITGYKGKTPIVQAPYSLESVLETPNRPYQTICIPGGIKYTEAEEVAHATTASNAILQELIECINESEDIESLNQIYTMLRRGKTIQQVRARLVSVERIATLSPEKGFRFLVEALTDSSRDIQMTASYALGNSHLTKAIPYLIRQVKAVQKKLNRDYGLLSYIAHALYQLGDHTGTMALIDMLQGGGDNRDRRLIIKALGGTRDTQAVAPLEKYLGGDIGLHNAAMGSLEQIRGNNRGSLEN